MTAQEIDIQVQNELKVMRKRIIQLTAAVLKLDGMEITDLTFQNLWEEYNEDLKEVQK